MYKIIEKKELNEQVKLMVINAPLVAKKALPGQFIVLRVDDEGERIPLTIADFDRGKGTITIIFQEVGATTCKLGRLNVGDSILDFAGPLGIASHLDDLKKVCVIGGGLGCAIAYPQAKKLFEIGADVTMIAGFRNKDLVILEDEMKAVSSNLTVCTDDGSNGNKGLVTEKLRQLLSNGEKFDAVIAIGPLVMMKFVCQLTKEFEVKTIVSMNPIMVDGTGMCGSCRVSVGGEVKFACVDGPDFDGHKVDFEEAIRRARMYADFEKSQMQKHKCNLEEVIKNA